MKKKTCLDYYKLPLKVLDFDEIYIFTQNGKVAMNYIGICGDFEASKTEQNLLKDIINGDVKGEYTNVTISHNIVQHIDCKYSYFAAFQSIYLNNCQACKI